MKDDENVKNNADSETVSVNLEGDKMKENSVKSFFKKIGTTILKWLKSSLKWIIVGLASLLLLIFCKKGIKLIQDNDTKTKQNAKDDAKNTKEKIEESISTTSDVKTDVENIKEDIKQNKENIKNNEENYINKQKETAESAGFTKD